MSKKLLIPLFSLFYVLVSGFNHVFAGIEKTLSHFPFSDTTGKKDSSNKPPTLLKDPKEGFKDLFVPAPQSNAIDMEQLNPQATGFIEDYIEKHAKAMEQLKVTARPYFDMMDNVLTLHGLPRQLKYLAVIESYLKVNARSWAGAVGPWQFMPATARNMGLRVSRKIDERKDMLKSTHAASRYLTNLFNLYGDWLLVIAAYNGGPGKVDNAIRKSGSRDFWELQSYLPEESRNHVKKFIATHYMMEGEGGITTLTKTQVDGLLQAAQGDTSGAKAQLISGRYNAGIIVKHLAMDLVAFNKLNPGFDKLIASNGSYELHLPDEKMTLFLTKKFDILNESVQLLLNPGAFSGSN